MPKFSVNLTERDAAIQNGLAAWARFHLTLDRSIQSEPDQEMREGFAARQVAEFGKIVAFQKSAPLTYDHFRQALKAAGAEPAEEARFEESYKSLKLEAIKTRTLETAHAYKQAVLRARQRIEETERGFSFFELLRGRPTLRPQNSFGILL